MTLLVRMTADFVRPVLDAILRFLMAYSILYNFLESCFAIVAANNEQYILCHRRLCRAYDTLDDLQWPKI